MLGLRAIRFLTLCILCVSPLGAAAQELDALPKSAILTIDSERLFSESRFGKSLTDKIEARAAGIAAENRKIEADLADEERTLTDERAKMDPEKFRALADAFDEKVTRIRKERDERAKGLGQDSDSARRAFLTAVEPVLEQIMRESGAAVILEQRSVFVSRDTVDVTDDAIQRIDATLMDNAKASVGTTGEIAPLSLGVDPAAPEAGVPSGGEKN